MLSGIQTGPYGGNSGFRARGQPAAASGGSALHGGTSDAFMAHRLHAQQGAGAAQQRADASTQTAPLDPYCDAAFDGIYDLDLDPDEECRRLDECGGAYDLDPGSDDADERDDQCRSAKHSHYRCCFVVGVHATG